MKSRLFPTVALLAVVVGLYACGAPQKRSVKLAPETEIVLLYHSDTKAEIEECG